MEALRRRRHLGFSVVLLFEAGLVFGEAAVVLGLKLLLVQIIPRSKVLGSLLIGPCRVPSAVSIFYLPSNSGFANALFYPNPSFSVYLC